MIAMVGSEQRARIRGDPGTHHQSRCARDWHVPAGSATFGAVLLGRRSECAKLDALVEALRTGQSQALVIRGEAGVGKSALIAYLIGQASRYRVASAAGVESEME